jgi:fatty-acyl-CoA synthase
MREANVYGVAVPGADGRAGMAALTASGALDLAKFQMHLEKNLPAYARPVFLRMRDNIEATGTFKHTKMELVREGFDPSAIVDPLYLFAPVEREYVRLTPEIYADICEGKVRW